MQNLKKFYNKRKNGVSGLLPKVNTKLLVTLICFVFIGTSIYSNFESLSNQKITNEVVLWLLGGITFSILSIIINAYAWKLLIINIGCNSNKLNIFKLFFDTNIYKYLPGGIWHFVYRFNALRLEISTEKSIESILLEPILMLVAGLIFVPFRGINISLFVLNCLQLFY